MREFGKVFKYKNHFITVTKKKENYYTANYTVNGQEYYSGNSDIEKILKYFRSNVDKLMEKNMKDLTYEDIKRAWRGTTSIITYKGERMFLTARERARDKKVFYIGEIGEFKPYNKSFESIHYDKVVSKFQRFVDEYCTDWVDWKDYEYQGYKVIIKKDYEYQGYKVIIKGERANSNSFFGSVQFHKNSIFKCIASSTREIQQLCDSRIERVVKEKEKVQRKMLTPKQEKIQELEQLQARISAQLEELKKEKETWIYKEIVLELMDDPVYCKGILRGVDNPTPFVENSWGDLKKSLESYVDRLEAQYNLYLKLTGKE